MWNKLWRWAKRRHPNKSKKWIANKYFRNVDGDNWNFATPGEGSPFALLKHTEFKASVKWVKVEGTRSPMDGDWVYWSTRMGDNYHIYDPQKARLLKRQKGKCAYCDFTFKPDDNLEKHHLHLKSKGGNSSDDNMVLLHLHCHDNAHALPEHEYDNWVTTKTASIADANKRKRSKGKKRNPTKSGRHK